MMVGAGMAFGCPLSGHLSDKIFKSRKKVLVTGALMYTLVWITIWLTADTSIASNHSMQMVVNFLFGFFGGFFVVSYAQIKELYPIEMAGTSTATLNSFTFAGGAILVTISGFMLSDVPTMAEFKNVWLMAVILMCIACVCASLSKEKVKD